MDNNNNILNLSQLIYYHSKLYNPSKGDLLSSEQNKPYINSRYILKNGEYYQSMATVQDVYNQVSEAELNINNPISFEGTCIPNLATPVFGPHGVLIGFSEIRPGGSSSYVTASGSNIGKMYTDSTYEYISMPYAPSAYCWGVLSEQSVTSTKLSDYYDRETTINMINTAKTSKTPNLSYAQSSDIDKLF